MRVVRRRERDFARHVCEGVEHAHAGLADPGGELLRELHAAVAGEDDRGEVEVSERDVDSAV